MWQICLIPGCRKSTPVACRIRSISSAKTAAKSQREQTSDTLGALHALPSPIYTCFQVGKVHDRGDRGPSLTQWRTRQFPVPLLSRSTNLQISLPAATALIPMMNDDFDWIDPFPFHDPNQARDQLRQIWQAGLSAEQLKNLRLGLEEQFPRLADPDVSLASLGRFVDAIRDSELLKRLLTRDGLAVLLAGEGPLIERDEMVRSLVSEFEDIQQPAEAALILQRFYACQVLHVARGELIAQWPPDRVGRQLSVAIDAMIEAALQLVIKFQAERRGLPQRADGSTPEVTVIGLGSLGGKEVGYSSPLKLIFLYDAIDEKNVWHRDFYRTAVADVVQLLRGDASRTEGIDIDLREGPRYEVGVSICSFREAIRTYETSGRIWQRLSFVKARVVAGSQKLGQDFLQRLLPWIYRPYISRVDLAEIRTLRARIERRGHINQTASESSDPGIDIARVPGGRDDVELTIQFLQLLHGASLPSVRCGNTCDAIVALQQADCLTIQESTLLLANYARLCRLQHQLSILFDRSGGRVPNDSVSRGRLALHLGIRSNGAATADLSKFDTLLADTVAKNRKVINHLMLDAPADGGDLAVETELLLDPDPDPDEIEVTMRKHGLTDPKRAMENLRDLANETVPFLSPHRCRHFFSAIAPALLDEISQTPNPDKALSSLEMVTDSLGAKATLWELLASSRPTMKLMVRLCAAAPYLTEILTNSPGMIDELIDSLLMNRLPSAQRLDAHSIELCRGATDIDRILHSFKSSSHLTIGVRDILKKESVEAIHRAIGDTAEACVRRVIEYDQETLAEKYGDPVDQDDHPAELVTLALGKLGGGEPNYHSDLDAVFLYSADGETKRRIGGHRETLTNQRFFNQLAQRVINRINDPSKHRRLYELDSRMRPSDQEGGLVFLADAFFTRFEHADTLIWQRLAICKARPISGSRRLRQRIDRLIHQAIVGTQWHPQMATQIRKIRQRMQETAQEENLKRGSGGTVDVEFVAQMLTLRHAKASPAIIQRGTTATLTALASAGHLDEKQALGLINGYRTLRRIEANLQLMNIPARHELPADNIGEMKDLAYLMGESDPEMIIAQCQQTRHHNRAIFDQVFDAAELG